MSFGAKIEIILVLKKKKNATISSVLFRCHGGGGGSGGGGVTVIPLIFDSNPTKMPSTKNTDTSMRIRVYRVQG